MISKAGAFHQWHVIPPAEADKSWGRPTTRDRAYYNRKRHGQYRCENGLQPRPG